MISLELTEFLHVLTPVLIQVPPSSPTGGGATTGCLVDVMRSVTTLAASLGQKLLSSSLQKSTLEPGASIQLRRAGREASSVESGRKEEESHRSHLAGNERREDEQKPASCLILHLI